MRNTYRILITKHEGEWPLGRARHRRGDNIKIGLKCVVCESVN
jgi:hypothetical protein